MKAIYAVLEDEYALVRVIIEARIKSCLTQAKQQSAQRRRAFERQAQQLYDEGVTIKDIVQQRRYHPGSGWPAYIIQVASPSKIATIQVHLTTRGTPT